MFERLSAEPIYNTRAVVRRTGVPADTFRAWERRYGVPSPLRTEGNQRLYSERDIRMITWLREQTAVGLTISQAILLMRSAKTPISTMTLPVASPIDRAIEEVLSGKRNEVSDPLGSARRRLVEAFAHLDGQAAEHILQETFAWADLEVVLVELLHGAVVDVYNRTDLNSPESAGMHFARSFVQRKFASLYNLSNPNDGRGPVLSAAVEGEDMDLTLLLSAVFLSRAGYRVIFLGPNLPYLGLIDAIQKVHPAVLCLAATRQSTAATLLEWTTRLRAEADEAGISYGSIPICFSGRVFIDHPQLKDAMGGRFLGNSAQDSVSVVESAIATGVH